MAEIDCRIQSLIDEQTAFSEERSKLRSKIFANDQLGNVKEPLCFSVETAEGSVIAHIGPNTNLHFVRVTSINEYIKEPELPDGKR